MKRDMEFIKSIMEYLEDLMPGETVPLEYFKEGISWKYSILEVIETFKYLNEEGFVKGVIGLKRDVYMFGFMMITWKGHEFLDASRKIPFWERLKQSLFTGSVWLCLTTLFRQTDYSE